MTACCLVILEAYSVKRQPVGYILRTLPNGLVVTTYSAPIELYRLVGLFGIFEECRVPSFELLNERPVQSGLRPVLNTPM